MCLALLLAIGAVATADAKAPPKLHLADMQPVVVRGTGFKPVERVKVTTVVDSIRRARVVHSTRTGSFVVTFATIERFDPCNSSFAAYATGAAGDKASLTVGQRMCPPSQ